MKQYPYKTCLRYPGGKSKALKTLAPWFPSGMKEYREPFIGGGSVALLVSQNFPNMPVWVNDKYVYLYNFWTQLRDNGQEVSDRLLEIKKSVEGDDKGARKLFDDHKRNISQSEGVDQAVSFFILNKCSYSGLTENSTFSVQASRGNFSQVGIKKLPAYSKIIQNWKITNLDYSELMKAEGKDVFVFLDPPYDIKSFLYGTDRKMHSNFCHVRFAKDVEECKHKFMITYNVNDWIVERYKNFYQREFLLQYSMVHRKNNKKAELLISNYEVAPEANTLQSFLEK